MIKRKLTITVHDDKSTWDESYIEDESEMFSVEDDAQEAAEEIVASYNATLRPNDRPRTLDKVVVTTIEVEDEYDEEDDEDEKDEDE